MKSFLSLLLVLVSLETAARTTIKVGVLAPEGTNWSKNLKKMAKEIKSKTNNQVKLKIYFGGSQGDETDVLRKIRVGQLQGGVFTGKTLGDINGDVRVMELPFTFFHNREKAMTILRKMGPFFDKKFADKEFINLGFFEIGNVYFVSQKKTENLSKMKGVKIWSWEGDELVASIIETMGFVSVPLPLPDVLSSLSTGIVQAAYAPPLGIVSLQWNTKIKYIIDLPLAFSVGAFLVDKNKWSKISSKNQQIVREVSKKYIKQVNLGNEKDNKDALDAMKSMGVEFLSFPKSDIEIGKKVRIKVIEKLKGKLFSIEALNKLEKEL